MKKNISDVGLKCYGCRGCENICPKKCIQMVQNDEGFIYPKVNENLCINCGLCSSVCQSINDIKLLNLTNSYGFISKKTTVLNSASGGFCDAFSRYIINRGGVVFGAAYIDGFKVVHTICDDKDQLSAFQSSKYVSSDVNDTYTKVKLLLDEGKLVLYTGTSCQIAGLLLFLKKEYKNLYTISLICHGVPSYKAFRLYLDSIEKKYKDKIVDYNFRYKGKHGHGLFVRIEFSKHKTIYRPMNYDTYGRDFLEGKNYRISCYSCKYTKTNRVSDFSVGDFWGVEKYYSSFKDELGVSAILVNSTKGKEIISEISDYGIFFPTQLNEIVERQVNLKNPTPKPEIRDNYYNNMSIEYFSRNIMPFSVRLKMLIPNKFKKIIKKIIRNK